MANVNLLRGGNPQAAPALVSADQQTILGDGTARNPLRAVGTDPTIERVTSSGGAATLDPNVGLSIVSGESPPPGLITVTLPDGDANTPDGFQHIVACNFTGVIDADQWRLSYNGPAGAESFDFASGGGGGIFIWNATEGFWNVVGSHGVV